MRICAKMIWILSLLFLASIGGSFSDDCRMKAAEQCDHRLAPDRFPQSAEEFMTSCLNAQTLGTCILDAQADCDEADKDQLKYIRRLVDYSSTLCVEDNPTFKVITNNLQCIESNLPRAGRECRYVLRDENAEINEHLLSLLESNRTDTAMCRDALAEVKCKSVLFGYRCGDDVKEATEDIFMHMDIHGSSLCTPETIEELKPFMEVFGAVTLEQLKVEYELENRK